MATSASASACGRWKSSRNGLTLLWIGFGALLAAVFCICTDVRVREREPPLGRDEAVQGLKGQVQGPVPCYCSISIDYQRLVVQQRVTQRLLQLRSFFDWNRKESPSLILLEMLLLTNLRGCLISVAMPPHLYSEKAEVSPMLKEPVEDDRNDTFWEVEARQPWQTLTVTQVFDFHGAEAVELRHALDRRERNDSVVGKPVITRTEHHSRIVLPFIHIGGFSFGDWGQSCSSHRL